MSILCYHAIEDGWPSPMAVTPSDFAEQCAWVRDRRTVLPLSEAVRRLDARGRLPRGQTALTFDDGFASMYDQAWPVLARHGLPWTIFLVAETLTPQGRPVDWVDTPPPYPLVTLTRDQVLEMADSGVDFQSHSWAHKDLTALSEEECVRDLQDSRDLLEDLLRRPVRHLAYPRGRHDTRVHEAARRAGYSHAYSLPEQRERPGPHAVPRVGIHYGNRLRVVRAKDGPGYLTLRTSPVFAAANSLRGRPRRAPTV